RRALPPPLRQRPRRLALEVEDHPVLAGRRLRRRRRRWPAAFRPGRGVPRAGGPERLPEVVVAVRADHPPGRPRVRALADQLAHLLAAAADRIERLDVLREIEEDARDLLVDARGQQAERL